MLVGALRPGTGLKRQSNSNSKFQVFLSRTACSAVARFPPKHENHIHVHSSKKVVALATKDTNSESETAAESNTGFPVDLSTTSGQSLAFGYLWITSAFIAAVTIIAPDRVLESLLPETINGAAAIRCIDSTLVRVLGATFLLSAAAEYCLQDAAVNSRLSSPTYQRLMTACIIKSSLYLYAFFENTQVWTLQLFLLYPSTAALSIYINWNIIRYSNIKDGVQQPPNLTFGLENKNNVSWVYSAFILIYLATAAACYAPATAPSLFNRVLTPTSKLIEHMWAPGFFLAAVASLNLKDGSDRGRLAAGTFKRLNLGLAVLESIYTLVFGWALLTGYARADVAGLSNLVASAGIAGFCAYQYKIAKK